MRNYFNYFTEIEERFQQRRGALLLLSTLDWALIETWRDAGIPLEAVLRGIDNAFDKYETRQKRGRMRRVNGLAWCAQAVMEAAEELREASAGSNSVSASTASEARDSGFEHDRVAAHLESAANALVNSAIAPQACAATAVRLRALAAEVLSSADAEPTTSKPSSAPSPYLKKNSSPRSLPPPLKRCSSTSKNTPRASSHPTAAAWAPCSCARWSTSSSPSSFSFTMACRASASST